MVATTPFISPTINIEVSLTMPPPSRLNHPYFKCHSATHYEIQSANPNDCYTSTVHIGQIADFLSFDEHLRERKSLLNIGSIPLGYLDFSDLWNNRVSTGDTRRFSSFYYTEDSDVPTMEISDNPLSISDFFITRDQVGLYCHKPITIDPRVDDYARELADMLVATRRKDHPPSTNQDRDRSNSRKRPNHKQRGRSNSNKADVALSRLKFTKRKINDKEIDPPAPGASSSTFPVPAPGPSSITAAQSSQSTQEDAPDVSMKDTAVA